jgi:hypothetical protein
MREVAKFQVFNAMHACNEPGRQEGCEEAALLSVDRNLRARGSAPLSVPVAGPGRLGGDLDHLRHRQRARLVAGGSPRRPQA